MTNRILSGLICAPFTPMDANGAVDTSIIPAYADFIASKGCLNGVFICGTSGESLSLTADERKAIAEAWVKAARGRFKVIVHVGGNSQPECIALAAHAQAVGADVIAAMSPSFFKPASVDDLIAFFKPVCQAASGLPFFYYNMPSISGVSLPVDQFLTKGRRELPNLAGVKFTHNNLMELQMCVSANDGEFEVLNGFDEILIAGLACGCNGAVGSTYNYMPGPYRRVYDAVERGDIACARSISLEIVKVIEVLVKHGGGTRAGKIFMKLAGFDCGQCRLPIAPCSDEELEHTRRELEKTEFFSFIAER